MRSNMVMQEKKTVRIDLTGCKYYMEMFERIRLAFGFDDDFGRNWDALWDSLHMDSDAEYVEVIGAETVNQDLYKSVERLKQVLEKMKNYVDQKTDFFDYRFLPASAE